MSDDGKSTLPVIGFPAKSALPPAPPKRSNSSAPSFVRRNKPSNEDIYRQAFRRQFGQRNPLSSPGIGAPAHAALTPREVGLSPQESRALKAHAKRTGRDLYVRDGNPSRLQHLGKSGTRPKPEGLYNKTAKTGDHTGLVEAGQPGNALDDHSGQSFREEKSTHLVKDHDGNTVHGDIDFQRVSNPDGSRVSAKDWVPGVNQQLGLYTRSNSLRGKVRPPNRPFGVKREDKVQHGAHDEWDKRNDMGYAGGRNAGPIPGVTKFSAFGRDEHYDSTADYQGELSKKGQGNTYTLPALRRGAQRDQEQRTKAQQSKLDIFRRPGESSVTNNTLQKRAEKHHVKYPNIHLRGTSSHGSDNPVTVRSLSVNTRTRDQ